MQKQMQLIAMASLRDPGALAHVPPVYPGPQCFNTCVSSGLEDQSRHKPEHCREVGNAW